MRFADGSAPVCRTVPARQRLAALAGWMSLRAGCACRARRARCGDRPHVVTQPVPSSLVANFRANPTFYSWARVFLAWHLAPEATLAAFLTASVWQFGTPVHWRRRPCNPCLGRTAHRRFDLAAAKCDCSGTARRPGTAFAVLPLLTAFSFYFVAVHAPFHVAALIRHPSRAPRVQNAGAGVAPSPSDYLADGDNRCRDSAGSFWTRHRASAL